MELASMNHNTNQGTIYIATFINNGICCQNFKS